VLNEQVSENDKVALI